MVVIKIDGFSEVMDILKGLAASVKNAANIPEENRKEMRAAIADTAELVDETLTILKQHLNAIASELKFGDTNKAKCLIYELGDFQGWENKFRQFQLCDALRRAASNLERKGLYALLNNVSYADPTTIQQRMWDYIGGETNAANSVGTMLKELSFLADEVDSEKDEVVRTLEEARNEVSKWRQAFIDIEKEIRTSI